MSVPLPQVGSAGVVQVNGVLYNVAPGTWQVVEADRFGAKLSTGSLKYSDFNPYESAHAVASFIGGYGLRRYSDVEDPSQFVDWYDDPVGFDGRFGVGIMGPQLVTETIPSPPNIPVWLGEVTPSAGALAGTTKLVAVAGTKVYYRNSNGTWTDTGIALPATAVGQAIGVFGGNLVIGFGASATAVYTNDLATTGNVQNSTPANIYVYAFTADRANTYVAGGPASTDSFKVTSSTTGISGYSTSPTICGASDSSIVSLAPGGGVVTVFVGRTKELGEVDASGVYRVLLPFDSYLSTNCQVLRWFQGTGGAAQRGPLVLVFNRDHSLWEYEPSTQSGGEAQNISPWAQPGIRPITIRGIPQSVQGTAGFLYWIAHSGASAWLISRDAGNGAHHPLLTLSSVSSGYGMTVSSLFGGVPRLFFNIGNDIGHILLPLDGDNPLDDSTMRYATSGSVTMPDIDLGFPDENKIAFEVRVVADNLSAGVRQIEVQAALDGGSFTSLGTVSTTPSGVVTFPTNTSAKRIKLKFVLTNTDVTQTLQFLGFSLRVSINAKLYRIWNFEVLVPGGTMPSGGQDTQNPQTTIANTWTARKNGFPVAFVDRWQDTYQVRILKMAEIEKVRENTRAYESTLEFQLLEVSSAGGNLAYGDAAARYDAVTSRYA